ncbi:hypothetical protein GQE99_14495 [Maritimibacter sp. DP07]|uniref:Uncharacterized protein n=1 Tax=Maritimibacter harenae TaxID=2606218 RepID=A0A845M5D5_9RHOB|nr:hypothetical protein [Maritimibacter harenae]MZR14229.1 hypothetical protein [Maritimibacter harenae]
MSGAGAAAVNETTLDGSTDALTYNAAKDPLLVLANSTGGALTPTITGDEASSINVSGVGAVDLSGGFSVGSIADGEVVAIPLRSIEEYLAGAVTISGGTGIVAQLLEF